MRLALAPETTRGGIQEKALLEVEDREREEGRQVAAARRGGGAAEIMATI